MRLSADLLEAIIWSLASDESRSDKDRESRRRPRVPALAAMKIYLTGTPTARDVAVRDISADGVSLLSDIELTSGDEFVASIERLDKPVGIVGRVTHCAPDGKYFRVGAQFVRFCDC